MAAEAEAVELLAAAPDEETLEAWLGRREKGEPLAWITEKTLFCGRPLYVSPGVYVPRKQTEELARRAGHLLPDDGWAVDLCTGTGAVAAHLQQAVPGATVVAVDIDRRAAACARRNRVPAFVGDLAAPLHGDRRFDVVTAVAPYVPTEALGLLPADVQRYEPRRALDGGAGGLEVVRRVIAAAGRLLRPGGWLLVEIGGEQDSALAPPLAAHGFTALTRWWDDDGDLRGVAAQVVPF